MTGRRRSIRLQSYDYRQDGAYFVTICTYQRLCLYGEVVDDVMVISDWGCLAQSCWHEIPRHYPMVELDAFVVMPNHVHGIIVINNHGRGMACHAPTPPADRAFSRPVAGSLATIIGSFKSAVTRGIRRLPDAPNHPVWQRNYYEHVIRSEDALNQLRAYIAANPARWAEDSLFV